eukprot:COSAG02_NODE_4223_length_5615_cov_2.992386_10_plen_91_part_01
MPGLTWRDTGHKGLMPGVTGLRIRYIFRSPCSNALSTIFALYFLVFVFFKNWGHVPSPRLCLGVTILVSDCTEKVCAPTAGLRIPEFHWFL